MPPRRRLSAAALLLLGTLALAALATPALAASSKQKTSSVGLLDDDDDDFGAEAAGGLVSGYGDLGWISVADFEVRGREEGRRREAEGRGRGADFSRHLPTLARAALSHSTHARARPTLSPSLPSETGPIQK